MGQREILILEANCEIMTARLPSGNGKLSNYIIQWRRRGKKQIPRETLGMVSISLA